MTSLSKQLETLRTATARQLTVEKKHVSLLFDKQESQKLDRETCYKIGCTGFAQLKKLDPNIFEDCAEFFEEAIVNFQRTMISKEENQRLNNNLEKFIIKLAPYFMHFSCQQVLEWLIYKFQIYAFNSELLIAAFLPYHDTNIFGRLLSIIEFNFSSSKDWAFLEEFSKKKMPVPFNNVVKNALSSNHSMLSRISDHIEKSVEAVGAEFIETRSHLLFTFYAKVIISALDMAKTLDENLISKIVPIVGNGLRSSIPSFRNSSMMIVCQLCNSVKLSDPVVSSITKILIIKMQSNTLITSLSTVIVICQLQNISTFSKKAVLKLLKKAEQLKLWQALDTLADQTDLLAFLAPFWSTLFSILLEEETPNETRQEAISVVQKTILPERLSKEQAAEFLSQLINSLSFGLSLPTVQNDIYNICLRFPEELEMLITEWTSREEAVVVKFLKEYKLENLKAVSVQPLKRRQRRRSNSLRRSTTEQVEEKKDPIERARIMAENSEFTKKQSFKGDPIKKAEQWIQDNDVNNITWALEEISLRKNYFINQLEEEAEEFIIKLLKFSLSQKGVIIDKVKTALTQAPFRSDFIVALLSRHEEQGSTAKKSRGKDRVTAEKEFIDEDESKYWKRVNYVVDILTIAGKLQVDPKIFKLLFGLLKESDGIQDGQFQYLVQHSIINLLTKIITTPGNYKITIKDLQMDSVVETMRATQSHHILRDSLKLLTAAVALNPGSITSHIMSVFTFMGSGLLRKDNDLTLGIIEKTLEALFSAVVHKSHMSKLETAQKLIAISRVFAASAPDIPAHRRPHMAKAISRAIGHEEIWIVAAVMIEGFCSKWQRADPNKNSTEQDAFEDIAQELCSNLTATEQLKFVLDIVQFVVRLGGDTCEEKKADPVDSAIFDRTKFTVQKLRHFRFLLIGVAVKILSNRLLLEKLAKCTDDELYKIMLPIGKRLLTNSVALDEFGKSEEKMAEASGEAQTLRYWIALQARCDLVSDKLRYLLPGGVAARIITDVLEDDKTEPRMREKVLQLANVKLLTDGFFYSDSGINEKHLTNLAFVLNKWIVPIRSDNNKIELCKNATFSLRLVAKRIPKQSESSALTNTMQRAVEVAKQWNSLDETMVGNTLLLAGELIRSHNMRCTMLSCEPLLVVCFAIIKEFISSNHQNKGEEEQQTKRQRVRQQSLSGRKLGSDTLLIASLTCLQRILDQFAAFISSHIGEAIVRFCQLSSKFPALDTVPAKGTVQHRMLLIRIALTNLEFRTLPEHFTYAISQVVGEEKALCALMNLIGTHFKHENRVIIASQKATLVETIFIPAFSYRNIQRKPENFENIANVEQCISKTLLKMCDMLTESELRSVITTIVQWAEPALSPDEISRNIRIRLVTLFHFANEFFAYFNQLAMPYFGKLLEIAPKILLACNTSERVDAIAQALIEELTNTRVAGHEARCVPHLSEALYRICDASPETVPDFLNKIMLKTRNNRAKVRFRTLLVLEALLNRIGDSITPHLPVIMPFLSELLEDENKNVEDQCDKVIRTLQKKFGENISDGFA